jgi:hypothetical protein
MGNSSTSHEDLLVWQKAVLLYTHFLRAAHESKAGLETQLVIAKNYPLVMRYNTKQ